MLFLLYEPVKASHGSDGKVQIMGKHRIWLVMGKCRLRESTEYVRDGKVQIMGKHRIWL